MIRISVITSLYHSESYLRRFLENAIMINNSDEIEILLLLNQPSDQELSIIQEYLPKYTFLKLIVIPQREGLYATWNRGVKLSRGKYCTIWNVDDIRTPDSISDEANTLDSFPDAGMTYGNYILTEKYGDRNGILVDELDSQNYNREIFRSHLVGCFPMWRKSIHEKMGYFDEQYKLVADYEFQIRCAYNFPIIKTQSMLGYFLQGTGGEGRLSQSNLIQDKERTSVEIRYGIFDKINLLHYFAALKSYDINKVSSFGECHSLNEYIMKDKITKNRSLYLKSIIKLPLYIGRYLKHRIK